MQTLSRQELRVVAALASIFSLRMLGLCMLLPVFALEAINFSGANEQLIGLTIGVYGLAQAILQIPFGMLSDKYGRRPVMLMGLALLLLGSLIAAQATSIYGLICGRILQGSGAIGSVVIATLADHTREQVRGSAMAILGVSIGLAFVLAMVLGPWINQFLGLQGVFGFTGLLAVGGIILLLFSIPKTVAWQPLPDMASSWQSLNTLSSNTKLMSLNFGIFVLHASLAALFLVLPLLLQESGFLVTKLWQLYLAALILALLVSVKLLNKGEKGQSIAIAGLLVAECLLLVVTSKFALFVSLCVFFTAFCILEASLPTLVSKYAPTRNRGAALGVYSCLQFLGIFFGGIMGGWLHGRFGLAAVLGLCMLLAATWFSISLWVRDRISLDLVGLR